eukprot:568979-Amphidinium_carterae.2
MGILLRRTGRDRHHKGGPYWARDLSSLIQHDLSKHFDGKAWAAMAQRIDAHQNSWPVLTLEDAT